jgi:hypothetical protein
MGGCLKMQRIKLGQSPYSHKVTFNGKEFKIQGKSEKVVVPLARTETAQVDILDHETGYLQLVGKESILAQLELPISYCELGKGWILDKLSKSKKKSS